MIRCWVARFAQWLLCWVNRHERGATLRNGDTWCAACGGRVPVNTGG